MERDPVTQITDQEAHDTFITPGLGPSPVLDTTTPETPGGGSRPRRYDWLQPLLRNPKAMLGRPNLAPSSEHWVGTDGNGRDVFSQLVWGARTTLRNGFAVGLLTTIVGC